MHCSAKHGSSHSPSPLSGLANAPRGTVLPAGVPVVLEPRPPASVSLMTEPFQESEGGAGDDAPPTIACAIPSPQTLSARGRPERPTLSVPLVRFAAPGFPMQIKAATCRRNAVNVPVRRVGLRNGESRNAERFPPEDRITSLASWPTTVAMPVETSRRRFPWPVHGRRWNRRTPC
jgi:hypothetical protein